MNYCLHFIKRFDINASEKKSFHFFPFKNFAKLDDFFGSYNFNLTCKDWVGCWRDMSAGQLSHLRSKNFCKIFISSIEIILINITYRLLVCHKNQKEGNCFCCAWKIVEIANEVKLGTILNNFGRPCKPPPLYFYLRHTLTHSLQVTNNKVMCTTKITDITFKRRRCKIFLRFLLLIWPEIVFKVLKTHFPSLRVLNLIFFVLELFRETKYQK